MLKELSKQDQTWYSYAVKICGDKDLAKDLVNDMYIKLYNSDLDTVNKGYIYRTIRSIFIDQKRKEQEFVPIDSITLQLPNDTTTERRFELLEMLKTVSFFEREVLIQTHEKSLRDCEKDTNISFQFFHYHKKKALSKLQNKYNGRTGTNG